MGTRENVDLQLQPIEDSEGDTKVIQEGIFEGKRGHEGSLLVFKQESLA